MTKTVFITGATGNIGGKLVARILSDQPDAQLILLVRGDSTADVWSRVERVLHILAPEIHLEEARQRIRIVCGDITKENFGLPEETVRAMAAEVTHIIHSAATTQFHLPLPCARETNVTGTANVLAFARLAQTSGHLERVAHLSTAYVCGDRGGTICENETAHSGKFANTYEQTKWEAEQLVRAAMADLPIAIFRPSIVVGDSRTGRTTAFNVLYTPLRFIRQGVLTFLTCPPDTHLDVVPVDYVSDAIHYILFSPANYAGRTFHLTAGDGQTLSVREIVNHAVTCFNRTDADRPLAPVVFVNQYTPGAEMLMQSPGILRLLDLVRTFEPYTCVSRTFDDANTRDALKSSSITAPALSRYLEVILDYGTRTEWGKLIRHAA